MKKILDFENVFSEEAVAQNVAVVEQQVVTELHNAFVKNPSSVVVKFQNARGVLNMNVQMSYADNNKYTYNYQTYADIDLVEAMLCVMNNPAKANLLAEYKADEHKLEASESDPRSDLFRQFMASKIRCTFDKDYQPNAEESYVSATFHVANKKEVKFCLKRTDEVEAIINEAIHAA